MEGKGLLRPILCGDIGKRSAFRHMEVIHSASERGLIVATAEMVDHCHFRAGAADNECMWVNGGVCTLDPVENFYGTGNLNALGDKEERAGTDLRTVQRGEAMRTKLNRLGHKKLAEEVRMLAGRCLQRDKHNALRQVCRFHVKEAVVAQNNPRGKFRNSRRTRND